MDKRKAFILLVDDEPQILKSYRTTLLSKGISNVITCEDSSKVMPIMESQPIDVVVLDLIMPEPTGEQLLDMIGEKYPDIPVIIVTALNEVEMAVKCLQQGARDYMVKPVERNRFVSGIQRMMEIRRLEAENKLLKQLVFAEELKHPDVFREIVTQNKKMISIFKYMEAIGPSPEPILITGETGVGKELFSQAIHQLSGRSGKFIAINVAGLDDNMFSDTLFGHQKGAFTDAHSQRSGLVEEANGGTLFLDEIGDLNHSSQVKLLRLLQEKEYYPLGCDRLKRTDCRVICSTNHSLKEKINDGSFRNDLYYRLNTHNINIPPLRDRQDDIPVLFDHYFTEASESLGKSLDFNPACALSLITKYQFPGNVRELRALVYDLVSRVENEKDLEQAIRMKLNLEGTTTEKCVNGELKNYSDIQNDLSAYDQLPKLEEFEKFIVQEALNRTKGNISSAAKLLGVHRHTISNKLTDK